MESVNFINSDAWLSIVEDRPPPPPSINPQNTVEMQDFAAESFEWTFSVSLATQGITSDKNVADKVAQTLAR